MSAGAVLVVFQRDHTPEGNLTLEEKANCDWLSSACEIEELRFPVFIIYGFICLCLFRNSLEKTSLFFKSV